MTGPEDRETRLRRLSMRSSRRGIKEMDLILGRFAAARLSELDGPHLDLYDALLTENDQDLYAWVAGQSRPPERYADLIARIAATTGGR
jgi:antitoxin CptB